jgi:cell division protein FtsB
MRQLVVPAVILGLALAWAAWDAERGLPAWLRMRADLAEAHGRMADLRRDIEARELEAAALGRDALAIEEAIRRDLGLARPGEIVVRIPAATDPNLRIP